MSIIITSSLNPIDTEISLPASKSISNRVLIINALCGDEIKIDNLSTSGDTVKLSEILLSQDKMINAGEGGTTLRFFLALFALKEFKGIVTASGSLLTRPVAPLIDALNLLGAEIEYPERENFLPVKFKGNKLSGNEVTIAGDISSQFISALMLIGPSLKNGLTIHISGEILSLPYILMTKSVMEYFGASVSMNGNSVIIPEGKYIPKKITIEPDWSAASYWYEIVALNPDSRVFLHHLVKESLQGDSIIHQMMQQFGVQTTFTGKGALLTHSENFNLPEYFSADFSGCPDIAPAIAATCAGLNITADLHGLKNFRLKESDRASALQRELYMLNVKTDFCGGSKFKLYSGSGIRPGKKPVNTYNDHRIAMSMAPLTLKTGIVELDDETVVNKSYPGYFNDLEKAGFDLKRNL